MNENILNKVSTLENYAQQSLFQAIEKEITNEGYDSQVMYNYENNPAPASDEATDEMMNRIGLAIQRQGGQ